MAKRHEGVCTGIALYDVTEGDLRGLFQFVEDWFLLKGQTPLRANAYGDDIKSDKTKTFSRVQSIFKSYKNLKGFWFGAYNTTEHDNDFFDSIVNSSVDLREHRWRFYLCFHHNVVPFVREEVEQLIKDVCQFIKPGYGIVFHRDWNRGPGLYVDGINTNCPIPDFKMTPELEEIEKKERELNSKWWKSYSLGNYTPGQLRDIYPMNVLSNVHLEQTVLNTTLKSWIESSTNHGELKQLTDDLWEWWVDEDKISIIREALKPSGIIICA